MTYLISIHALHEESDLLQSQSATPPAVFQSTLSMRRATQGRTPHAGPTGISIHALHEESDPLGPDTEE